MECKNLNEVRTNIDRIDNEIVKLIAERGLFVEQAAKFKKDTQDVKAPDRVELVIKGVKKLAEKYNADSKTVEKVYRAMIESFINMEMDKFNDKNK